MIVFVVLGLLLAFVAGAMFGIAVSMGPGKRVKR